MIWNTYKLAASHLSRTTSIFVVDCCEFGPNWIHGLKMELIACADLVGGTTYQSCLFPDLIWYYQWYETLPNFLHHTSSVPQPFLLLISTNLDQAGLLYYQWYETLPNSLHHTAYWLSLFSPLKTSTLELKSPIHKMYTLYRKYLNDIRISWWQLWINIHTSNIYRTRSTTNIHLLNIVMLNLGCNMSH